jgi:hypothetical protein
MQELSRQVRRLGGKAGRSRAAEVSYGEVLRRSVALASGLDRESARGEWRDDSAVRILVQMLQAEEVPVRLQMVKMLSAIKGDRAGAALAQRAVFDLSPQVREAAVKALQDRPRAEYRPTVLAGLRYPWAPAADHAAEALVALEDQGAVFDLAGLLERPDPRAPVRDEDRTWRVAEVVRVNHLGNCLLCHAPSQDRNDPVRGLIPERGKPLREEYYESRDGNFVRADVTYLKQDFSALQPVPDAGAWPRLQRFDYLVRRREFSADEAARLAPARAAHGKAPTYPQREAVLWALRQLTGEDVGGRSEDWYRLLLWPWLGEEGRQ